MVMMVMMMMTMMKMMMKKKKIDDDCKYWRDNDTNDYHADDYDNDHDDYDHDIMIIISSSSSSSSSSGCSVLLCVLLHSGVNLQLRREPRRVVHRHVQTLKRGEENLELKDDRVVRLGAGPRIHCLDVRERTCV